MEEDIENVKFIIRYLRAQYYNERFVSSLENVLSRLKQLEEENKILKNELEEKGNKIWQLKETIKDLENECISLHQLIDEEM